MEKAAFLSRQSRVLLMYGERDFCSTWSMQRRVDDALKCICQAAATAIKGKVCNRSELEPTRCRVTAHSHFLNQACTILHSAKVLVIHLRTRRHPGLRLCSSMRLLNAYKQHTKQHTLYSSLRTTVTTPYNSVGDIISTLSKLCSPRSSYHVKMTLTFKLQRTALGAIIAKVHTHE